MIDLVGKRFGKLTVLSKDEERSTPGYIYWKCQCDCGGATSVYGGNLRKGHTQSCGCLRKIAAKQMSANNDIDISGKKYNFLTAIKRSEIPGKWIFKCDCGNIVTKTKTDVVRGTTKSCGCKTIQLNREAQIISMVGKVFGKLTVIKECGADKDGSLNYLCKCACGNYKIVNGCSLRNRSTSSCGCINYSIGERNIARILTTVNIKYKQEYCVEELNRKRFDFAILNAKNEPIRLIEFDGIQHFEATNSVWETSCPFEERQIRDQEKNQWAKDHNIPLVRIPYWERDKITLEMIMEDQYLVK